MCRITYGLQVWLRVELYLGVRAGFCVGLRLGVSIVCFDCVCISGNACWITCWIRVGLRVYLYLCLSSLVFSPSSD